MTNPIDIIANAIRTADGNHTMGAGQLAEVVAVAVTDLRIIDHAAEQLRHHPDAGHHSQRELKEFATIVLRSVGGAS